MDLMPGVVVGIVKRLDDEAGEGRIQVQYPWLGEQKSGWAPVAAPLAGKSRGAFFMPEPEDEVLLAFEQGYTDHPFIVGFLWNGRDRPPETEREMRVIHTPGGHQLRFEDKEGSRKVVITSSTGHTIELDDTAMGNFIRVKTAGHLSLTLDDLQTQIVLSGGGRTLTMQGGQFKVA
jgi:uncharacterized protein involved in type VI secretion and phage assembly